MTDGTGLPEHIKRKPDVVCIGAQKSGTSWLHEMMDDRPDMWVPPFKEQHFFDHKFLPENRKWTGDHVRYQVQLAREKTLRHNGEIDPKKAEYLDHVSAKPMFNGQWYQYVFSRAPMSSLCVDVTPEYSTIPEEGVEFVAKFLPRAKFIYLIRHPVARAMSQLNMNLSRAGTTLTTDDEWLQAAASDPEIAQRGDYAQYVPRWQRHFDEKRLLILPYGRIGAEPVALLRDIEEFVDVRPFEYNTPERVVSQQKRQKMPQVVQDYFAEKFADQVDFLRDHFGQAFLDQT